MCAPCDKTRMNSHVSLRMRTEIERVLFMSSTFQNFESLVQVLSASMLFSVNRDRVLSTSIDIPSDEMTRMSCNYRIMCHVCGLFTSFTG